LFEEQKFKLKNATKIKTSIFIFTDLIF
jgi:hypothetical protein